MTVRMAVRAKPPKLEARRIRRRLKTMMDALGPGKDLELSVALVTDAEIRDLNKEYLGKDEVTDVISFPLLTREEIAGLEPARSGPPEPIGDIVISFETAERQAAERGHKTTDEIELLAAHGLLHLFGYDHTDEAGAREMAGAERMLAGQSIIR